MRRELRRIERALMDRDAADFTEDLPEPGWKERLAAVKRAVKALAATRTEIFREELAGKGSLLGMGMAGLVLAFAFASLALLLATALVAALFARLFGSPIAGIAAALVLYLLIAAGAGFLGVRSLGRVRPLDFPATRDELRKDLDAIREEATLRDRGPASPDALAAERASIRPGGRDEDEDEEKARAADAGLEERFRAGSE